MTSLKLRERRWLLNRQALLSPVVFLCCAFLFSAVPVLAQQNVGFVLEMRGKWATVGNAGSIKQGQLLPAQAMVENTSPADEDRITIANLHGEIIQTIHCKKGVCRECTKSGACYDPIHPLPKTDDSGHDLPTLFNAVLDLFSEKPDRYSVHRVRGEAEGVKAEVLLLEANAVDLSSLLKDYEKGRYQIQFIPISQNSRHSDKTQSFEGATNWNPGEKAPILLTGIAPGLYEVALYRGSSTTTAWVLLRAAAEYRSSVDSFEEFARRTENWGDNVTSDTKEAYQRAFLEYLDLHKSESHL
jgi:hypothetical protein